MNDTNEEDWMKTDEYDENALDAMPVEEITENIDDVIKQQEEQSAAKEIESIKAVENNPTIERMEIAKNERLPLVLEGWVKEATNVSHHNDIPAVMTGLVLIGQMVKQFVKIPIKASLVDSRIHFVWIQTSGTGKSELMNFVIPVSEKLWTKINAFEGYKPHEDINCHEKLEQFDNFDVVEYTDAALIGYQKQILIQEADADAGLAVGDIEWEPVKGSLDGHGLARWDEFTNAGVFKQSQHKESVVTYLNTLMNSIGSSSQTITKKLKEGPKVFCHSERSVLATTFPPKNLDEAITETGLFQRAVLYIWEVPEHIKDEIDDMVTDNFGVFEDIKLPIDKYTEEFFEIYKLTKARFLEVDGDATATIQYSKGFKDALHLRKMDLRKLVSEEDGAIRDTARSFMTRLIIMMGKISVLCCIAESVKITEKDKRFVVSAENANQAHRIIRNCYKSLISWFIHSLRERKSETLKIKGAIFLKAYNDLKGDDGWVNKTEMFEKVKKTEGMSQTRMYVHFKKIESHFYRKSVNKSPFLKLKGDEK